VWVQVRVLGGGGRWRCGCHRDGTHACQVVRVREPSCDRPGYHPVGRTCQRWSYRVKERNAGAHARARFKRTSTAGTHPPWSPVYIHARAHGPPPFPKTAPMHAYTPHARKRTHLRLVGLARTQHLTSPSLLLSAGMRAGAVWGRHVRSTCLEQGRRVRGQAARAIASRTHNDANLVRCTSESARAHPAPLPPPNLTQIPPFACKTLNL